LQFTQPTGVPCYYDVLGSDGGPIPSIVSEYKTGTSTATGYSEYFVVVYGKTPDVFSATNGYTLSVSK